jgi:hypothetical protein
MNKPRQIILSDEQWEELRLEAYEKHQSISSVIRTRLFATPPIIVVDDREMMPPIQKGTVLPTGLEELGVGFGSSIPVPKPGKTR